MERSQYFETISVGDLVRFRGAGYVGIVVELTKSISGLLPVVAQCLFVNDRGHMIKCAYYANCTNSYLTRLV